MNKIIVIGCPGSGKSYFSKKLKDILDMPIYHLDLIWNKPDKTTISREEFDKILNGIFKEEKWIMDGNYQRTLEMRIKACDTIILLDFDLEVSLDGATSRVGKDRDDMPWQEDSLNEEFKNKILNFRNDKLPEIYRLLDEYKDEKGIIIFKNRDEANKYLESLVK